MRYQISAVFAILLISFTSCNKNLQVTACIELSKSNITANDSITFTSCSENEWSYLWEISGPDSLIQTLGWSDRVFTQQFTMTGAYKVKLTTFNDFSFLGDSASDSVTFNVN